jgi:hypothetical protein
MVTIWITAEACAALAGHRPDPSAYNARGGGFPFVLEPAVLARLKPPRAGRQLERRDPEIGESVRVGSHVRWLASSRLIA